MEPLKPRQNIPDAIASSKKAMARGLMENVFLLTGICLLVVPIVVFFTNAKLADFGSAIQQLTPFMALLWFCNVSMYYNCSQAGEKEGKIQQSYIDAITTHDTLKNIIEEKYVGRGDEFCEWFSARELEYARRNILLPDDVDYEIYIEKYVGKNRSELKQLNLPKKVLQAIIKANSLKPVHFTFDMIMKRGKLSETRRGGLGISPTTKKRFRSIVKLFTSAVTVFVAVVIVLEVIVKPSWATFAMMCLRLLPIILSAFQGYLMGYNNIVEDTVSYVESQSSLLKECIAYLQTHEKVEKKEAFKQEYNKAHSSVASLINTSTYNRSSE